MRLVDPCLIDFKDKFAKIEIFFLNFIDDKSEIINEIRKQKIIFF